MFPVGFYLSYLRDFANQTTHTSNQTSSDQSTTAIIGGLNYISRDLTIYIFFIVGLFVASLTAIFGNLLIIVTILLNKSLRSLNGIITINLSVADFLIGLLVNSFNLVGIFGSERFFADRKPLCTIIGFACLVFCGTSLSSIVLLALNRLLKICYSNEIYTKVFTCKKTLVYCFLSWCAGIVLGSFNLFGVGGYTFDRKVLSCMTNRIASHSHFVYIYVIGFVFTPCLFILFSYLKIFLYVHNISKQSKTLDNSLNRSYELAKSLFASFITFFVCWIPFGIIYIIDGQDILPRAAILITILFAHLNSSVNFIYYGYFSVQYRRAYLKFLHRPRTTFYSGSASRTL